MAAPWQGKQKLPNPFLISKADHLQHRLVFRGGGCRLCYEPFFESPLSTSSDFYATWEKSLRLLMKTFRLEELFARVVTKLNCQVGLLRALLADHVLGLATFAFLASGRLFSSSVRWRFVVEQRYFTNFSSLVIPGIKLTAVILR